MDQGKLGYRRIPGHAVSRSAHAARRREHEGPDEIHRQLDLGHRDPPVVLLLHPRLSQPVAAAGPGVRAREPPDAVPPGTQARRCPGRSRGATAAGATAARAPAPAPEADPLAGWPAA